ncbi:hypothetical protein ACEPAF_933 [Sanghuangporus sanghuang]
MFSAPPPPPKSPHCYAPNMYYSVIIPDNQDSLSSQKETDVTSEQTGEASVTAYSPLTGGSQSDFSVGQLYWKPSNDEVDKEPDGEDDNEDDEEIDNEDYSKDEEDQGNEEFRSSRRMETRSTRRRRTLPKLSSPDRTGGGPLANPEGKEKLRKRPNDETRSWVEYLTDVVRRTGDTLADGRRDVAPVDDHDDDSDVRRC